MKGLSYARISFKQGTSVFHCTHNIPTLFLTFSFYKLSLHYWENYINNFFFGCFPFYALPKIRNIWTYLYDQKVLHCFLIWWQSTFRNLRRTQAIRTNFWKLQLVVMFLLSIACYILVHIVRVNNFGKVFKVCIKFFSKIVACRKLDRHTLWFLQAVLQFCYWFFNIIIPRKVRSLYPFNSFNSQSNSGKFGLLNS